MECCGLVGGLRIDGCGFGSWSVLLNGWRLREQYYGISFHAFLCFNSVT